MNMARDLGAQGVQIYATKGEMAPENLTPEKISEKKSILDANGMKVSALCGDLEGHGFQIAEDNTWKIEKSKRIVDLALELGAKVVTTHIGVIPDTKNDTYKIMQQACNDLAGIRGQRRRSLCRGNRTGARRNAQRVPRFAFCQRG